MVWNWKASDKIHIQTGTALRRCDDDIPGEEKFNTIDSSKAQGR